MPAAAIPVLHQRVVNGPSTGSGQAVRLRLGGLVLGARVEGLSVSPGVEPHFRPFLTDEEPDLDLVFREGDVDAGAAEPLFDSGGVWTLFRLENGAYLVELRSEALGDEPYARARIDGDLRHGEVRLRTLDGHVVDDTLHPFMYPLDEVLVMTLLGRRRGLLVHAAAIDDSGRGLLFPGVSGAGKSTLSRLWFADERAQVLTDDRTVLRFDDEDRTVIHGTPWHGEAQLTSAGSAPLAGVFFLEQGPENRTAPLSPAEAAAELISRSFPTWWDAAGIAWALEAAERVMNHAPAFRLYFRPDRGALAAVREALG